MHNTVMKIEKSLQINKCDIGDATVPDKPTQISVEKLRYLVKTGAFITNKDQLEKFVKDTLKFKGDEYNTTKLIKG